MSKTLKPIAWQFDEIRIFPYEVSCSSCGEEYPAGRYFWTYFGEDAEDYVDVICSECDLINNYDLSSSWPLLLKYWWEKLRGVLS